MRKLTFILCGIVLGCGGSLSEDQRKRLHEGMEEQQILKVSDSEIVAVSLDQGRVVFAALEKVNFEPVKVDSIAAQYQVRLRWITPGSSDALAIESQLIEAYVTGAETGSTQDNIQKIRMASDTEAYDSLLYSRPVITPLPDGAVNVEGVWNIYFAKKRIILSFGKK